MKVTTLDEVLRELDALNLWAKADASTVTAQLAHCAQSIEFSMTGYPAVAMKSPLFRKTIGKIAKWKFIKSGKMSHDTSAPSVGAPTPEETTPEAAVKRLRSAIDKFRAHTGPLQPHLAYGDCTREEYDTLHALHVADHFRALS